MILSFLLGKYPKTHFLTFVSVLLPVHFIIRVFYNVSKRQGFFLTDFCYFANAALFVFIHFTPKNETLFRMVYIHANGPLAAAIFVFRCTFAIHKPDMLTGVLIHVVPFVATNLIRWQLIPEEAHLPEDERFFCSLTDPSDLNWSNYFYQMVAVPMMAYWCWLTAHGILVFYIYWDYIYETKQSTMYTLYWEKKWAVRVFKWASTLTISKLLNRGTPEKCAPTCFCIAHSLFQLAALPVAMLAFKFYWVAMLASLFWIWCAFYNGACYYMDWFASKYEEKLAQLAEIEKQVAVAEE